MKIFDAPWEKRNLGVVSKEINLEIGDMPSDLDSLSDLDCDYAVARVPAGLVPLMFKLEDMGFRFIETILHVAHDHKNIGSSLNSVAKRIADSVTYAEMNENEFEELWGEIRGGIFFTDRISLDPAFSPELAANRYVGWIGDLLERGGKVFKCSLKDDIFGYFTSIISADNFNVVNNIGIYKKYENAGLGMALVNTIIRHSSESGAKKLIGGMSANNLPSLKSQVSAGFQITGIDYIYVRHRTT